MREPVYAARRRFGPHHGERWTAWVAWSGLAHVRELISLDTILCPEAPERLVAEVRPTGFDLAGFELLDVHGDVSALTDCGGFPAVFAGGELNSFGLLSDLSRADDVRRGLRTAYPDEPHAECDVWALWRLRSPEAMIVEAP